MLLFFWCFCLSLNLRALLSGNSGEWGQIKINEPRNSGQSHSYNYGNSGQTYSGSNAAPSSSYRAANAEDSNSEIGNPVLVQYMLGRKGEIVQGNEGKYTYKVHLFEKVEQTENYHAWNLGMFDKWDFCDETEKELCLVFNDGQVCGNGHGRQSHLHFTCDAPNDQDANEQHLYGISEPLTCSYHFKLYIPHICRELLHNNDLSDIFADSHSPKTSALVEGVLNAVNMDAVVSLFNGTLNELKEEQRKEQKRNDLGRLCLMSLLVQNKDVKLSKLMQVATSYNVQFSEICDVYLEQMLNRETTSLQSTAGGSTEDPVSTSVDDGVSDRAGQDGNGEVQSEEDTESNQNDQNDQIVFQSGSNQFSEEQ